MDEYVLLKPVVSGGLNNVLLHLEKCLHEARKMVQEMNSKNDSARFKGRLIMIPHCCIVVPSPKRQYEAVGQADQNEFGLKRN